MTEPLSGLFTEKESLDERIAIIQVDLDGINEQICKAVEGQCKQARDLSGKDYGSIDIVVDGVKVKHNVPKKVTWDQEKLSGLWDKIEKAGDNPMDFMEAKYSIPEKKYNGIPTGLKKVFDNARTVNEGKVAIKLEWVDKE